MVYDTNTNYLLQAKSKAVKELLKTIMNKIKIRMLRMALALIAVTYIGMYAQTPVAGNGTGSGNALNFNGGSNSILVNNNAIWNNTFAGANKKFTISCWINLNPSSTNSQDLMVLKYADASCGVNERQFVFELSGSVLLFIWNSDLVSISRIVQGSTTLTRGVWHHVAVTYDGSISTNNGLDRIKFYIDGVIDNATLISTSGALGDIAAGPAPLAFGSRYSSANVRCDDGPKQFNGKMDEVCIWGRLLTQSEIRDNMCKKLKGNESGLVGYWRMDEGTGITTADLTINANTGALH